MCAHAGNRTVIYRRSKPNHNTILTELVNPTSLTAQHNSPADTVRHQFNPLQTKGSLLYLKTQSVPRSEHFSSQL